MGCFSSTTCAKIKRPFQGRAQRMHTSDEDEDEDDET